MRRRRGRSSSRGTLLEVRGGSHRGHAPPPGFATTRTADRPPQDEPGSGEPPRIPERAASTRRRPDFGVRGLGSGPVRGWGPVRGRRGTGGVARTGGAAGSRAPPPGAALTRPGCGRRFAVLPSSGRSSVVERQLPKLNVEGSSPFARSTRPLAYCANQRWFTRLCRVARSPRSQATRTAPECREVQGKDVARGRGRGSGQREMSRALSARHARNAAAAADSGRSAPGSGRFATAPFESNTPAPCRRDGGATCDGTGRSARDSAAVGSRRGTRNARAPLVRWSDADELMVAQPLARVVAGASLAARQCSARIAAHRVRRDGVADGRTALAPRLPPATPCRQPHSTAPVTRRLQVRYLRM